MDDKVIDQLLTISSRIQDEIEALVDLVDECLQIDAFGEVSKTETEPEE